MTLTRIRNILLAVAVATSVATAAAPPVALDIKYRVAQAPGSYFKVRVTIEPSELNRWACLYTIPLTHTGEQRSSCWQIDAETAPRTFWKELKALPVGRYEIVAAVIRNDEQSILSTRILVTVLGLGYETEPVE